MGYKVEGKLDVQNTYLKEPTGFTDPANVIVTYNPTNRTITLTGTVLAYWQGNVIPVLTSGWVSSPHDDTAGKWFLYYNGSTFVWSNNVWTFDMLMIALVIYEGSAAGWAIREPHGFMPKETHQELHEQVGTYSRSGNSYTSASFTLNSTTATNRRPLIDAGVISDEDIPTTIAALLSASYARVSLGNGLAFTITTGSSDIVNLSGNQPYYNNINTGTSTGTQVLMNNNEYQKLFVVAVPVTSEAYSQARRHLIFQGQTVSTNLATIQGVTFKSMNKGTFGTTVAEFVPIIEIIIRYTASNWQLIEVNNVVENRSTSITTTGLTTVATDYTLSGNGTGASPLTVAGVLGTVRSQYKQGADVASANNVTLGSDGNAFNITGNTDINLLNSTGWQAGSRVTLKFAAATLLKNNYTESGTNRSIVLSCGTDYTTKANQVLEFEFRADNKWYEVGESSVVVSQSSYWNTMPATPTRTSDTQFTIPDPSNTLKLDKVFSKGTVIRWFESSDKFAMVSSATYAANVVTVNILGNTFSAGFSNMKYTKVKVSEMRFKYNGLFSTAFTDCMAVTYMALEARVLATEVRCTAGSGGSGNLVLDINDDGVSIIAGKPTLSNVTSLFLGKVDGGTVIAEGSKVTVDIDSVLTTPTTYHSDGELILYWFPNNTIYF